MAPIALDCSRGKCEITVSRLPSQTTDRCVDAGVQSSDNILYK